MTVSEPAASSSASPGSDSTTVEGRPEVARRGMLFPILLMLAAVGYFLFVGYRLTVPVAGGVGAEKAGFLARCREICEQYGLLPSGDLAKDAKAYLEVAQKNKLSDSLEKILADETFEPAASQSHELIGMAAPGFELVDTSGAKRTLAELRQDRPIIVVFYYGYWCNHCVAQLFGLDKDLNYLRELGADVVAISADAPEHTAEKFKQYGQFHFTVLSDPDNKVAEAYRVFRPAGDGEPELLDHGTFVVDRQGKIVWANQGPEPFLDNKTLLFALKKAEQAGTADEANSPE